MSAEEHSITTAILSSLRSCGPESRIMVSKCIVVVGGIVGLPNMSSRLQEELLHLGEVARASLAAGVRSVASRQDAETLLSLSNCCLVQLPCVPSFVAWMGGSVIGSVDGLRSVSLSRGSWEEQGCRVLDASVPALAAGRSCRYLSSRLSGGKHARRAHDLTRTHPDTPGPSRGIPQPLNIPQLSTVRGMRGSHTCIAVLASVPGL